MRSKLAEQWKGIRLSQPELQRKGGHTIVKRYSDNDSDNAMYMRRRFRAGNRYVESPEPFDTWSDNFDTGHLLVPPFIRLY